jgi:hypothetical protein
MRGMGEFVKEEIVGEERTAVVMRSSQVGGCQRGVVVCKDPGLEDALKMLVYIKNLILNLRKNYTFLSKDLDARTKYVKKG